MRLRSVKRRNFANAVVKVLSASAAAMGIVMLGLVLIEVIWRGLPAMNWSFFTKLPTPAGVPGGGVANAILGSLLIVLGATLVAVPIGLSAGVFLSEFGRDGRFGAAVRFATNVMMGIPSIIVGLFVFAILVVPTGGFSGYAGSVALAIIMLPVVARTTEDMLTLVPNSLRESAMALGAPRWKVTLHVVFRAAKGGLLTGVLLGVARVSGETAPLLFTCLNSPYWPTSLAHPVANLPVTIWNDAMTAYPDLQQMAWGAALLITVSVLALTILTRLTFRRS